MAATPALTLVHLALRAKLLSLATLPTARAWENVAFTPTAGQPYVAEQFVPSTTSLSGLTRGGLVETRGLYIVHWYGALGAGLGALSAGADDVLALFPPESTVTTSSGDVVRIRGDQAPYRGQLRYQDAPSGAAGWAMIPITIPWQVFTLTAP